MSLIVDSVRRERLFDEPQLRVRAAPFAVVLALAFALVPLDDVPTTVWELAVAAAFAVSTVAAIALVPWRRLPASSHVLPMATFLATIGLLRDATGGAVSGYAPLVLVPVLWAAVFGSRRVVGATIVLAALTVLVPVVVEGEPHYPLGDARRAVLLSVVAAIAGYGLHLLVRRLVTEVARREQLERDLARVRAADVHDDIVQHIVAAQLGLAVGAHAETERALAGALAAAQAVVEDLLREAESPYEPGSLRRDAAAR